MGIFALPSNPGTNIKVTLPNEFPEELKFNPHGNPVQFYMNKNGQIIKESGRANLNELLKHSQVVDITKNRQPLSATFKENLAPHSPETHQLQALVPQGSSKSSELNNETQLAFLQSVPSVTNSKPNFEQNYKIVYITKEKWTLSHITADEQRELTPKILQDFNGFSDYQTTHLQVGDKIKVPIYNTQLAKINDDATKVSYQVPSNEVKVSKISYDVYNVASLKDRKETQPKSIDTILASNETTKVNEVDSKLLENLAFTSDYSVKIANIKYSDKGPSTKMTFEEAMNTYGIKGMISKYGREAGLSIKNMKNGQSRLWYKPFEFGEDGKKVSGGFASIEKLKQAYKNSLDA